MIKIEQVSKAFNGQIVLDQIDLTVERGQILVVLGESGTGKSVLLKHLMGLLKPDQGHVFIEDEEITGLPEKKLLKIRQRIGYLFQEGALYDFMNVFENIAFPLKEHTRLKPKEIADKVKRVLESLDLKNVEQKFPSELSGGMRKRVGLARAIILDSHILFCDEPTSGLDPIRSKDISDLIKDVSRKMNATTIITSHDIKNAARIADRMVLLRHGKIIADGVYDDIRNAKDPFIYEFLN